MPATLRRPVVVAVVIGVLVVAGALYQSRPSQPAVGGPSPTPAASSSPSSLPSPSVIIIRAPSWTATGNMARPREGATAVPLLDNTVLVIGGNSNVAGPAAEIYDPRTGSWTATEPVITSDIQVTATRLLDGRVLVTSGGGDPSAPPTADLYDPTTGTWAATGALETPRWNASATLLPDGKVLVAGGDTFTHFFNPSVATSELYDPVTGSWTATGSLGTARSGHTATLLPDGRVMVAGGINLNDTLSYRLASAELYDPATGTWAPTGDMTEARESHTATLLGDGTVLAVGGWGEEAISASAELYDPTTGAWIAAGSPGTQFDGFTATLLSDGRVLVAGGMDSQQPTAKASTIIYDPDTGRWAATADMIQGRSGHTATLLPDGGVLVAAGSSERQSRDDEVPAHGAVWLSSAELYDPGNNLGSN